MSEEESCSEDDQRIKLSLKILLIGDSQVGKTSLLLKYTEHVFPEEHIATIGVEYKDKFIIKDNYNIRLQIWDTAGQERFHSITKNIYRNANGVLFVYDITNKDSFINIKQWIKDLQNVGNNIKGVIIGNKVDLEQSRQVEKNDLEEVGQKYEMPFLETSAKTKKVDKKRVDTKMKRYFNYEIKILKFLDHPNIVKLEEVKMTQNNYYIVMEYINGGELSKILKKYQMRYQTAFPEQIVQYLMKQIVDALVYIHTRDIIHRDLKLENIMVSFDSERDKEELNMMKAKIKIIDFGFAIMLPSKKALTNTAVGTMLYMDPIILEEFYNKAKGDKNRGYGKEVDIWSLGCICYELFTGKYPFEANNLQSLVGKINQGSYRLPSSASSQIASFISNMLRYDGKSRLTAEELSAHPFLTYDVRNFKNIQANQDLKTKKYKGDIKDSIELYKEKKEKEILRNYINNNNSIGAKPIKEEDNISQIKNPKGIYKRTNTYSGTLSFYGQPMTLTPKPQMQNGAFQMPMNQFNMNGLQPHFQQINYGGAHPFGTFMNQNQIQNFQNQKTHY